MARGLRGIFSSRSVGKVSRFKNIGRGFAAVRSAVNFLGLRRGRSSRVDSGSYNTYTRKWDATKYMQSLAIKYLSKRPEYNPGWAAMVENMKANIKSGGCVSGTITKVHTYSRPPGGDARGPWHSVSYDISWNENLESATNHPDLMSNYIDEIRDIYVDYFESYRKSSSRNVTSEEEWSTRFEALDEYREHVEEFMSESD